jgi:enoyl-CoA hydratase
MSEQSPTNEQTPTSEQTPKSAETERDVPGQLVLYDEPYAHVARLTFNRPHRRNAILTPDMNREFMDKLTQAEDDDNVKVIVLTGAGEHFCAGEDVNRVPFDTYQTADRKRPPQSRRIRGIEEINAISRRVLESDKVVIAAVRGGAMGLGFNLALCCDLIVASEDATFARRQTRIGLAGFDMLLPVLLLKLGINFGYEVVITGRLVKVEELRARGVVASVVPAEGLEAESLRYAQAVAAHSTDGLMIGRQAKRLFWHMLGMSQWWDFVHIGHPLFTNLVWRDDEANMLRFRRETGNGREALARVYERWEKLGFE